MREYLLVFNCSLAVIHGSKKCGPSCDARVAPRVACAVEAAAVGAHAKKPCTLT